MRPARFHVLGGLALCAALCSCGPAPATAPSLSSFSVAPSTVANGVSTTVTWSFSFDNTPNPEPACTIDGLGPVTDGAQSTLTLTADTTFTLRCSNSAGESVKEAQVTVAQPGAPVLASFSANPTAVVSGTPTDVTWTWSFSNTPLPAPTCSISGNVGTVTSGTTTSVTLSSDAVFTLTCTNSAGTTTRDVTITTVTAAVAPSISTFAALPSSVTVGTATSVRWSWTYSTAPTPAPTCVIDQGVGTVTNPTSTNVTLAADTTFTLTCTNSAGTGSRQVTVTATPPVAPAIATFVASPASVVGGVSTSVTWTWTYGNSPAPVPTCSVDQGIGTIASGSARDVTLTADTVFTLTCANSGGSSTKQVTITLAPAAPAIGSFTATPSLVVSGVATNVLWKWSFSNIPTPAATCSIDQGVGSIPNATFTAVTLTADTTYTLTCTNSSGTDSRPLTIAVTPPVAPAINSFAATPGSVTAGVSTSVTWTWTYSNSPAPAPTCSIDQGIGTIASGSAQNVTLTADTVFTLTCTNSGGSSTRQVTVTLAPGLPVIATFTATPSAVQSGVATNVQWSWTYSSAPSPAPSCSIDQGVGTVTNGQVTSVNLTAARTYTLTCTNSQGTGTKQTTITIAPVNTISNGDFETRNLKNWTVTGTAAQATGGHSGTYAAMVGSTAATTGDSSISQTFTASTGATAVSFWYMAVCPDLVQYDWASATLRNNSTSVTTTVLAPVCTNTGLWQQVTAPVTAGTSYTLTLISHDDGVMSDPTYTLFDDVTLQ